VLRDFKELKVLRDIKARKVLLVRRECRVYRVL
jgi:hypothetical protein